MTPRKITRNVLALSWVSFFADLASEMLYPIIPLFLTGSLGASPALLGVIEGLAEGVSSGLRWIGGALSDRFGRRKPFVVLGYSLSAFSKPIMGLAALAIGWPLFLFGRLTDRLGKTVRTAARDALIADSTDPAYRGLAFGFHRAADTAGAILGPLTALALITLIPKFPLERLFFIALIPGAVSAVACAVAVREAGGGRDGNDGMNEKNGGNERLGKNLLKGAAVAVQRDEELSNAHHASHTSHSSPASGSGSAASPLPREFWLLVAAFGLFSLGNSSDSFLILRSKELGLSFPQVILAYVLYNIVYALTATPLGGLSDRIGRKPVILFGWGIYAAVYGGFAISTAPFAPWVLLSGYGLYQALTEGVSKAMVSDLVPSNRRAGALGIFTTVAGLGQLGGSVAAGAIWMTRPFGEGIAPAFLLGAGCVALAIPLLASLSGIGKLPRT